MDEPTWAAGRRASTEVLIQKLSAELPKNAGAVAIDDVLVADLHSRAACQPEGIDSAGGAAGPRSGDCPGPPGQGNRKVGTDHSFSWRMKGFNSIQLRCMPMNGADSPPRHSDD